MESTKYQCNSFSWRQASSNVVLNHSVNFYISSISSIFSLFALSFHTFVSGDTPSSSTKPIKCNCHLVIFRHHHYLHVTTTATTSSLPPSSSPPPQHTLRTRFASNKSLVSNTWVSRKPNSFAALMNSAIFSY